MEGGGSGVGGSLHHDGADGADRGGPRQGLHRYPVSMVPPADSGFPGSSAGSRPPDGARCDSSPGSTWDAEVQDHGLGTGMRFTARQEVTCWSRGDVRF